MDRMTYDVFGITYKDRVATIRTTLCLLSYRVPRGAFSGEL